MDEVVTCPQKKFDKYIVGKRRQLGYILSQQHNKLYAAHIVIITASIMLHWYFQKHCNVPHNVRTTVHCCTSCQSIDFSHYYLTHSIIILGPLFSVHCCSRTILDSEYIRWLLYMHIQELGYPWLRTEDLKKKKKLCQWNLFMILRICFLTKVYD